MAGVNPTYPCDLCPQGFWTKHELLQHQETHKIMKDGKLKFLCPKPGCEIAIERKDSLKAHIRTQHSNTQFPHKCPKCQNAFRTMEALYYHMWENHYEATFSNGIHPFRLTRTALGSSFTTYVAPLFGSRPYLSVDDVRNDQDLMTALFTLLEDLVIAFKVDYIIHSS